MRIYRWLRVHQEKRIVSILFLNGKRNSNGGELNKMTSVYTQKAVKFSTILKILAIVGLVLFLILCFIPQLGLGTWVTVNGLALLSTLMSLAVSAFKSLMFWGGVFIVAIPITIYSTRKYWHKQKVIIVPQTVSPLQGGLINTNPLSPVNAGQVIVEDNKQ